MSELPGVGPVRAQQLANLGIEQMHDLLVLLPIALHRQGELLCVSEARAHLGLEFSLKGQLSAARIRRLGGRRSVVSVDITDASGTLRALFFNQSWIKPRLDELRKVGGEYEIYGKLIEGKAGLALSAARIGSEDKPLPRPGTITPIYPLTEGLGQAFLRGLIALAIDNYVGFLEEPLCAEELHELQLPDLGQALMALNRPPSEADFQRARRRLCLEQLLAMQAGMLLARQAHAQGLARAANWSAAERKRLLAELPHVPTAGQAQVIGEILDDLGRPTPMGRLLQGDVGAGKTMVAQAALAAALKAGGQACLLAPTELLAEQHQRALAPWFEARGQGCELLLGSMPGAERRAVRIRLKSGQTPVVIGTHALFAQGIAFQRLDLVVIDEQQRFGVAQKASLLDKGLAVHVLLMTATPIPRTLALSIYGDLDVSLLAEKPAGRGLLKTHLVQDDKRRKMIGFIDARLQRGERAFWVRPRIDDGLEPETELLLAAMGESIELAPAGERSAAPPSIKTLWHELRAGPLGKHGIEVVHGRMPAEERQRRLDRFRSGAARLLLGTTIVEVGVDVPEATLMVIEGAERFGLSQLHQLRGRVGRGAGDAWCFLLGKPAAHGRLAVLENTEDGFQIAEQDLLQRGMGDLAGLRQAGGNHEGLEDPLSDLELVLGARRLIERRSQLATHYAKRQRARLV